MPNPSSHTEFFKPDARVAVVATLACSVSLFFVDTWVGMGVFAFGIAVVLVAARVPLQRIGACLVPLAFILACTILAQIPHGIQAGLFYSARIVLLALATFAVAFSYDSNEFTCAFALLLAPLRALGVPVDDISTMFSIALRFIPECLNELHRVADAQRSRGAKLDSGGFVARVAGWGRVFVPMLVGLFRRASVLSAAMEARCYGGALKRTSLHGNMGLNARNWVLLAVSAAFSVVVAIAL